MNNYRPDLSLKLNEEEKVLAVKMLATLSEDLETCIKEEIQGKLVGTKAMYKYRVHLSDVLKDLYYGGHIEVIDNDILEAKYSEEKMICKVPDETRIVEAKYEK